MRRAVLLFLSLLLMLLLLGPTAAGAQYVRKANLTTEQYSANAFRALFKGITLSPQQEARARRVILSEMKTQEGIDGRASGGWDRRIELNKMRDSTLRLLLTSESDQQLFDANARPMRPQGKMPSNPRNTLP